MVWKSEWLPSRAQCLPPWQPWLVAPLPEQLLQEADDILRGILGEPEALPGVTVQQVHPPRVEQQGPQQGQLDPLGLVSASAGAAARLAGTSNAQER